ncbi:developmentally-regulated protein [Acrasis kona]|uniref:Developmentally-regulated protein n=1 Tax=Acrasis kona TaxID=1008807 RepID=A0AAW2ZGN8_9EUKA
MKPQPLHMKNLKILPSLYQRYLEKDTSDSQEPFGGEQSPCTPTDALQTVFQVCPPTPTKTPSNVKSKTLKKKAKPVPHPVFVPPQQENIDPAELRFSFSITPKKPSPAAKRKFELLQRNTNQSPLTISNTYQSTHESPKVTLTPGRPTSAKSRRLFEQQQQNRSRVQADDDEMVLLTPTFGDNNGMDLDGTMTPPTNGCPQQSIFSTPTFTPKKTPYSGRKEIGTSSPTQRGVITSPPSLDLFQDDEEDNPSTHLSFVDSEDEDVDEDEFTSNSTSDREDEFEVSLGVENSQTPMPSSTPPSAAIGFESQLFKPSTPASNMVPFRLTNDSHRHDNPFSPERHVLSALQQSGQ